MVARETSDKKGIAEVFIEKSGKAIFSFNDLLPEKVLIITPRFFLPPKNEACPKDYEDKKLLNEFIASSGWWRVFEGVSGVKYLQVGDWRDVRSLLAFLHEIGHTRQSLSPAMEMWEKTEGLRKVVYKKSTQLKYQRRYIEASRKFAAEESRIERGTWAYALNKFREIRRLTGINVQELFSNPKEMFRYINRCLSSYHGLFIAEADILLKHKAYDSDAVQKEKTQFQEELSRLFARRENT